jgi:hypothetical protein
MSQERRYSFEFFPTKTDAGHEKLMATATQLASYNPDFFSCTYGAGGSTRDRTINTVLQLEKEVLGDRTVGTGVGLAHEVLQIFFEVACLWVHLRVSRHFDRPRPMLGMKN